VAVSTLFRAAKEEMDRNEPYQPVVKVQLAEKHPSGAKAHRLLSSICGTNEVAPCYKANFPKSLKPVSFNTDQWPSA
jgi:hypothetical protein